MKDLLHRVQIHDGFWSPYQKLVLDVVIPYQEKILNDEIPGVEKSHALANFRIAAGLEEGEFYGMVFQDSDVAKWLEGVAYALTVRPDADLERRADQVIAVIEQAQQKDGYLNTYFTIKEPEHRWQNLQECHELYCAGHMMEAAAAYYEATGKDRLLQVMRRMADHIAARFGVEEGQERGIPGHQEIELGLLRMYEVSGEEKYRRLARYFIEERGKNPDYFLEERRRRGWVHFDMDPQNREYSQCQAPVYQQTEAVGHSVRAVYMYTAMAKLAAEYEDEKLFAACERLWDNLVNRRMYLTGGIGSTVEGEAFTLDYDLPNDTAYAETCASIGLVFFARAMLENRLDGKYADVMERALYNGVISGMQLDGKNFFYVNPLEVEPGVSGVLYGYRHVLPQRPGWYTCACCPPNLVRLLASLGKYLWTETDEALCSHLFVGQEAQFAQADITVRSAYPWQGEVCYEVRAKSRQAFTLAIHIPSWIRAEELEVTLGGERICAADHLKNGYLCIRRCWGASDQVQLTFPLRVRQIYVHPRVRADAGRTALMRGPLVYCLEGVDNPAPLQSLRISPGPEMRETLCTEGVLKGMVLLKGKAYRLREAGEALYSETPPIKEETEITAIPYYAWGNRGETQMTVYLFTTA